MAKFKIGDWVEVTPVPDNRWSNWSETHDYFCGRIGKISQITESLDKPNDEDEDDVTVEVYFGDNTFEFGPNWYWIVFKKRHLILTSAAKANQYMFDEDAGAETKDFEETVRRKRDEIFKYIFSNSTNSRNKRDEVSHDLEEEAILFEALEDTL